MAADIVLCLPAGATARLNHLAGHSVCGQQGTVWLTVEGEPEDVLLESAAIGTGCRPTDTSCWRHSAHRRWRWCSASPGRAHAALTARS